MCLKLLNEVGFINYYESHEFGNSGNKHLIGKELILERWQEVIRYGKGLIVEPWLVCENPRNIALACFEYKSSRNVHKDLGMKQHEKDSKPIQIISSIKLRGKNLTKALKTVFYKKLILNTFYLIFFFVYRVSLLIYEFLTFAPISISSGTKSSPSGLQSLV